MSTLDQIMGVEEAAEAFGYSPGYIKNLCADGKLKAKKIGKTWIIEKEQSVSKEETDDILDLVNHLRRLQKEMDEKAWQAETLEGKQAYQLAAAQIRLEITRAGYFV